MDTLGTTRKSIIKKEEMYALNHGFIAKGAITDEYERGQVVKLDTATGEVEPIAAAADVPFGVLTAGGKGGDRVTVQTNYSIIMNTKADGVVAMGDELSASGVDADAVNTFKTSVAGDTVMARALGVAADGEWVLVGVTRSTYVKA